jgi:hypothetical protein
VTRWLRRLIGKGSKSLRQMEPIRLSEQLSGLDGQWVAIKDGRVVAAQSTVDALRLHLHERDIVGTSMLRVPGREEPELVGFG